MTGARDAPPIRRAARFGVDVELRAIRNGGRDWPAHWHSDLQLIATLEGLGDAQAGGTALTLPRGSLLVLPPGVVHTARAAGRPGDWTFLSLHAAPERLHLPPSGPFQPLLLDPDDPSARRFARLVEALFRRGGDAASAWDGFLTGLRGRWRPAPVPTVPPWLDAARAALEADFEAEGGVEAAARHAGVGRRTLERGFAEVHGVSPGRWRAIARVEAAKARLRAGASVAQAAAAAGVSDPRRFSRTFREVTGITARAYRTAFTPGGRPLRTRA